MTESPFDRALRGLCACQNAVGELADAGAIAPAAVKLINSACNLAGDNIRAAQSFAEYTRADAQADAADAAYNSMAYADLGGEAGGA